MRFLKLVLLSLCMAALLVGCGSQATPTPQPPTATPLLPTATTLPPTATSAPLASQVVDLLATAQQNGNFSTLLTAIQEADLTEKLGTAGPYTIFAPTDAAFAALPVGALDDPDVVFEILLYHVVEGTYGSESLQGQTILTTLLGDDLTVTRNGDSLTIGDVQITATDIQATNGVIHVIDQVLMPPSLEN